MLSRNRHTNWVKKQRNQLGICVGVIIYCAIRWQKIDWINSIKVGNSGTWMLSSASISLTIGTDRCSAFTNLLGYLIHPSIPTSHPALKIADVGTGTGVVGRHPRSSSCWCTSQYIVLSGGRKALYSFSWGQCLLLVLTLAPCGMGNADSVTSRSGCSTSPKYFPKHAHYLASTSRPPNSHPQCPYPRMLPFLSKISSNPSPNAILVFTI